MPFLDDHKKHTHTDTLCSAHYFKIREMFSKFWCDAEINLNNAIVFQGTKYTKHKQDR